MNKIIKRTLISLSILLIGIVPAYSDAISGEYNIEPVFIRITTNLCGYNAITKRVAQKAVKKTLNKNLKGDYDVKIGSFSGIDLKKGKFKGMTIDGKNLCLDDCIYFSTLHIETTSDFNYVDYKKKPIEFKTDIPMNYTVEINEDDLNKTISQDNFLNYFTSALPFVNVDRFKFRIENEKIKMYTAIRFPFGKTIKISVSAQPEMENGKIVLKNIQTTGTKREFSDKITEIINSYNLLENIKLHIFDQTSTIMAVKNVKITDKKIHINGTVVIKKV